MADERRYGIPTATYRLQLHAGFTFDNVRRLLPYIQQLGISHLYFSPIFTAAPGSTHGYDVFNHNQINPELGGLAALYELGEELVARDLGLILDIVPNHVGIAGGANPWWRDVLRYGPASHYADYFDIDWEAQPHLASGVLVYPILGQPFGAALEAGELQVRLVENDLALCYYEHCLPLAPSTYPDILGLPPLELRNQLNDPAALSELIGILEELRTATPEQADVHLDRSRRLIAAEPAIRKYIEGKLTELNGEVGQPQTFDKLDAILNAQNYRLTYWRVSSEEINYRRFFDINDLAGIRVEREDVFEEVHRLLLELVTSGIVTGVRVDHVDGLYDPGAYLRRLREALDQATPHEVPIYVEKILEEGEELPRDWPVEGTTGYDFMSVVDGLLINPAAARPMTELFREVTRRHVRWVDVVYNAKRQITETAFAGEINVLAARLHRIARRRRLHRDNTLKALRDAIEATLASFPVYRTYIFGDGPGEHDAEYINRAIRDARRRNQHLSDDALGFLREVLLLEGHDLGPDELAQRIAFRRHFQQLSGPVMAKGLEDTAMYRYNRLMSLNEVGSDPGRFGILPQEVQEWFARRADTWPHTMNASTTHDTKRAEDVRARLDVLSEVPEAWEQHVRSWMEMNAQYRGMVEGDPAPGPNTEYLIYQNLVGSWPVADPAASPDYVERLHGYLAKAMREMKALTSWVNVDEPYEEACQSFLGAILDPERSPEFIRSMSDFVDSIRLPAALDSLTALTLKVTAPGMPDFYQGCEVWNLSLTDPDNRRPVNWQHYRALFDRLHERLPSDLTQPEAKLWMTVKLLRIRQVHKGLLTDGDYVPLATSGTFADNVFAYVRQARGQRLVALVPRLTTQVMGGERRAPTGGMWRDTTVTLPEGEWCDELTGGVAHGGEQRLSDLLADCPFAVLTSSESKVESRK